MHKGQQSAIIRAPALIDGFAANDAKVIPICYIGIF
jgi:hypothetical protein